MAEERNLKDALWRIVGNQALRAFEEVSRYQNLLKEICSRNYLGVEDRVDAEELCSISEIVPYQSVEAARFKCITFINNIRRRACEEAAGSSEEAAGSSEEAAGSSEAAQETTIYEESADDSEEVPTQKTTSKFQKDRLRWVPKSKKMLFKKIAKKNGCSTSQKHSFNKLQNSKSISNSRKNFRHAKLTNSAETSQSDMKNEHSKKVSKRRNLKKKTIEMNHNKPTVKETELTRKVQRSSNYSTSNSINESFELKSCIIELMDFMCDPSADNDPYIAQYKQANDSRANEEIDFVVVDPEDNSTCEKRADSHNILDNSDDKKKNELSTEDKRELVQNGDDHGSTNVGEKIFSDPKEIRGL